MNKILGINKLRFSIKKNQNQNYSFLVGKKEVLCLNKRIVELGVGIPLIYSILKYSNTPIVWANRMELSSLQRLALDNILASNKNYINDPIYLDSKEKLCQMAMYSILGLSSIFQIAGYKGMRFLLLTSSLYQHPEGFTLWPTVKSFAIALWTLGEGLILPMSVCVGLIGISYLVKKYGSKHINMLLDRFNYSQNTINIGVIDIKDNLKYQFSILGRDILCLKKAVL